MLRSGQSYGYVILRGGCRFRLIPFDKVVQVVATMSLREVARMKYLCLIYDEEKKLEAMGKAEFDALMGEYFAFTKAIRASGHYLGGNDLQPVRNATTIRIRNGQTSTTDGPFAETKEQLGGYYLVEAKDMDEALKIAERIPSARYGSIEVRPVVVWEE